MKVLASLPFLAALARAVSVDLEKRASPLDVKLEMVGNSAVKATVTNTGSTNLKVFKTGSFLDEAAVEKADVFSGGECSYLFSFKHDTKSSSRQGRI